MQRRTHGSCFLLRLDDPKESRETATVAPTLHTIHREPGDRKGRPYAPYHDDYLYYAFCSRAFIATSRVTMVPPRTTFTWTLSCGSCRATTSSNDATSNTDFPAPFS